MNKSLVFLSMVILLIGCSDNFEFEDDFLLTEGFIVPLAQAELESGDIFSLILTDESIYTTIGADGSVSFSLQDTIITYGLNDFVSFSELTDSAEIPFATFNYLREYTTSFEIPFSSSMADINEVEFSYNIIFKAEDFAEPIELIIEVPEMTSSGETKVMDVILSGNQEILYSFEREQLTLDSNKFTINVTTKPCRQTGVYEDYTGMIFTEITDIELHSVSGVFKDTIVDIDSSEFEINLDQFDELSDYDPEVSFIINNSFPFSGLIDMNIYAFSSNNDLRLIHPDFTIPEGSDVISSDTFTLSGDNSNISNVLDISPDLFTYSGSCELEPVSTSEIEMDENDSLSVEYLIEYPSEMAFNKEIESEMMDISESDFIQDIEQATLTVEVLNEFPLQTDLIMYLYNSSSALLDSITFPTIEAAEVNSQGITTESETEDIDKELSDSELANLKLADKLKLKMTLQTGGTEVIIRNDYNLSLKLALKAKK